MTTKLLVFLTRFLLAPGIRGGGCFQTTQPRVFFANHTSNLDALIVWTSLPDYIRKLARPVAGQDYWLGSPLRRWIAIDVFNAILIERKKVTPGNNPIELLIKAIDDGFSLILFPEGGRHDGSVPGPFKSGLFHLAKKRPHIELVPVFIDNANRILPKGEFLPVPILSSITFGSQFFVNGTEAKTDFLNRARDAVIDLSRQ